MKWESTSQSNLGLDLSLFRNKLAMTVDIYRKTTYDLLLNADLPFTTGYTRAFKNIGKVRNQGVEISISSVNISTKDVEWNTSFNISINRSEVLALNQGQLSMSTSVGWDNPSLRPLFTWRW